MFELFHTIPPRSKSGELSADFLFFRKGFTMLPLTTKALATVISTRPLEPSAYRKYYLKAVADECALIIRVIQPGKSVSRVITPKKIDIRVPNRSIIKEDFSEPGCMEYNLLRDLYRDKCPKGINLSVTARAVKVTLAGQEASVTMMVVSFMIPKRHTS